MSPATPERRPRHADVTVPAHVFAALGDQTRLRLVARLCRDGPLSIGQLTSGAAVTRQAVAKHLHVLEGAGLVRGRRRGRESLWELEAGRLALAREYLGLVSRRWDATLARLKDAVER